MTRAWMLCSDECAARRLAKTYHIAGEMMLATTLTSCAAFLATALLSPMVAMQCLGYITAASLLFDYLLVLSFYAACLYLRHHHTMSRTISTPAERKDDGASEIPSDDGSETPRDDASEVPRETDAVDVELQSAVKKHCLQSPLQRHRRRILCFFALFEVPFIVWQLRDLSIDNLPPSFLPWDHPLQRAYLDNADFSTSPLDVFDTIHIFWGLKADALDMEGVYRLRNKGFVGRPKLDRAFRFDGDAQAHMLRACMVLRASDLVPLSADFTGDQTLQKAVQCWPEAFEAFVAGKGMPFPVDNASLAEEMLLDWIGEETALNNARGFELAQDIGFVRAEAGEIAGQDDGGRKLLFVKLRASSTIPATFPPPYEQLNSQYTSWEELVDEINAGAPPSASHAVQVIVSLPGSQASDLSNKWVQVSMHTAYVTLTGTGLAIGLAVCLPVLLLSTQSLRVSAIATFCLLSVILGVLASMLACGWKIGMIEALCLVIVSGLAVDPVLHVASAFNQAQRAKVQINPIRCAEEAVRRMGPPMLASAITTLASAISLSTCQLTLLSKIGMFLIFSTTWSLGTSATLLPALLATFDGSASCTAPMHFKRPNFLDKMLGRRSGAIPLQSALDVERTL